MTLVVDYSDMLLAYYIPLFYRALEHHLLMSTGIQGTIRKLFNSFA